MPVKDDGHHGHDQRECQPEDDGPSHAGRDHAHTHLFQVIAELPELSGIRKTDELALRQHEQVRDQNANPLQHLIKVLDVLLGQMIPHCIGTCIGHPICTGCHDAVRVSSIHAPRKLLPNQPQQEAGSCAQPVGSDATPRALQNGEVAPIEEACIPPPLHGTPYTEVRVILHTVSMHDVQMETTIIVPEDLLPSDNVMGNVICVRLALACSAPS